MGAILLIFLFLGSIPSHATVAASAAASKIISANATPAPKTPEVDVADLVAKLQKTWDSTQAYSAQFKQIIFSKRIGTRDESEGNLFVAKPNRLRWESKSDGSIQILNGNKLVNVQENKRRKNRVIDIYSDTKKAMGSAALNFLAGKAKFKDLYTIKLVSETPKQAELKLTPKKEGEDTLIAEVDKATYQVKSLTTENADSRVRIEFSSIKTNVPLDDGLFEFKPGPKDIVHEE